jgi:hypothetical protein
LRKALGSIHVTLRSAGILLFLVLVAFLVFIWLSPSRDLNCDVRNVLERHRDPAKALERHQEGKKDWCD